VLLISSWIQFWVLLLPSFCTCIADVSWWARRHDALTLFKCKVECGGLFSWESVERSQQTDPSFNSDLVWEVGLMHSLKLWTRKHWNLVNNGKCKIACILSQCPRPYKTWSRCTAFHNARSPCAICVPWQWILELSSALKFAH
jgi:hypothetical protein